MTCDDESLAFAGIVDANPGEIVLEGAFKTVLDRGGWIHDGVIPLRHDGRLCCRGDTANANGDHPAIDGENGSTMRY